MFGMKKKAVEVQVEVNPVKDLIDKITPPEFTPDVAILEQQMWNFVFIPDECMLLGTEHDLVNKGASGYYPFYEDCYTSSEFTFLEKNLGKKSFPIAFKPIDDPDLPMWMNKKFRIKGEMYALSAEQIISLDKHRLNTVQFDRVRVNINIPHTFKNRTRTQSYNGVWHVDYSSTKAHIKTIEAYMYVGRFDYWRDQLEKLDNFDQVAICNDPDRIYVRKYYDYKQQE